MGKKLWRAIGAVLIALSIALWQIPAPLVRAVASSGDFDRDDNTIYAYNGTASVVSVPGGIKRIDSEAFSNRSGLTVVNFPSTLEEIGNGAFRSCNSLTDVVLPANLTTLESGAFAKCENLRSFRFDDSLETLGSGVFSGDMNLSSLSLGKNPNFVFKDGALYNADMSKLYCVLSGRVGYEFQVPESVQEIDRYAFWGDNLREVQLSPNLYEIPEFAFSNCENLTNVTIPLSVRNIGAKAFEDCVSLGDIRVPAGVSDIHDTAFDGCRNLNIISDEGTAAYEFFSNFDRSQSALMAYEDDEEEDTIGASYPVSVGKTNPETKEKAADPSAMSEKFDPSRPADVSKADVWEDYSGEDAAMGQTRVVGNQAVILPGDFSAQPAGGSVSGNTAVYDTVNPARLPLEEYPKAERVISPDASGNIPRRAYYQDETLSSAALANNTLRVGDLAFARSSLTSMILPDGLTQIGYGAFYHCDDLEKVRIPDSVTDISPEAFDHTPFLENWKNGRGDDYLIVGDGVLLAYRGSGSSIRIPDEVKKIAGGAFRDHNELQKVTFGGNLTEIGEGAFENCGSLAETEGGSGLEKIADRAFAGCPLERIKIPANMRGVGLGAFAGAVSPAVVFETGTYLPALSYEQTSTRLSNDDLRNLAFGDVQTAVVAGTVSELKDTVLDENYLGFRGLVVTMPDGMGEGKGAVLLKSSLPAQNKVVRIPDSVTVDGIKYPLKSAASSAFSGYDTERINAILLPAALGSIGDYVPELALDLDALDARDTQEQAAAPGGEDASSPESGDEGAVQSGEKDVEPGAEGTSYVETVDLDSGYPLAALIKADPVDDDAHYRLFVSRNDDEEAALNEAVTQAYGAPVNGQLTTFTLQMVENATNVPITHFGRERVSISVPVSETVADQQICAVSLASDGSLQTHFGTKSESEGQNYFTFTTNHFSPYGIYAGIGDTAVMIAEQTAQMHNQDETPDTGDHAPLLTVLEIFLAAAGLFMILGLPLAGGRRKQRM